jgi:hypothetical protein
LNAAILLRLRTGRLAGFIERCQPSAGIKPPSDPRLEARGQPEFILRPLLHSV